jgi:stage II sporulation protein D
VLLNGTSIVNALFHSTGGGATENNENVFVSASGAKVAGAVSYLRGSSDRDPGGASYDAAAPYATWNTKAYSVAALSAIFAADPRTAVGTLATFDFSNRGVSGRLISVKLTGSGGTKTVSGSVLVSVFNAHRPAADPPLRSTLLDVAPVP